MNGVRCLLLALMVIFIMSLPAQGQVSLAKDLEYYSFSDSSLINSDYRESLFTPLLKSKNNLFANYSSSFSELNLTFIIPHNSKDIFHLSSSPYFDSYLRDYGLLEDNFSGNIKFSDLKLNYNFPFGHSPLKLKNTIYNDIFFHSFKEGSNLNSSSVFFSPGAYSFQISENPLYNNPLGKDDYIIEIGGKYDVGSKLHFFGAWDYVSLKGDSPESYYEYKEKGYDWNYNSDTSVNDLSSHFTHLGVTYDVTNNFSVQGNFSYIKTKGVDDAGLNELNNTIIPGVALRYQINEDASLVFDYKYYSFSDEIEAGNDYRSNEILTRLNIKF